MKIGICAGEPSGDNLGADLINSLKKIFPDASFTGIAGPKMQAAGCESLFPMETLSVMGVAEVIPKLPAILSIRRKLIQHFIQNPPDVFIGIDSPDFMLAVEKALKKRGVKTVHYVSPTVWAWREKRVLSIKKSTDLMLCVFPFEPAVYAKYGMKAEFIGHPAAERFRAHEIPQHEATTITLMPGSRSMEIKYLAPIFYKVAQALWEKDPSLRFLLPAVKPAFKGQLEYIYQEQQQSFPLKIMVGNSRECMEKGDLVLCSSGTTTLEAMFLKKPMVVAYKMSSFNWWLAQRLVKVKYIAIPNLLADKLLVPEFIQEDANINNLTQAVEHWIRMTDRELYCDKLYQPYCEQLTQHASEKAAHAILQLIRAQGQDNNGKGYCTTTHHGG